MRTLFIITLFFASSPSYAYDFILRIGAVQSTVQDRDKSYLQATATGFTPAAGLKLDVTRKLSVDLALQPFISVLTSEIYRTAIYGSFEYAVIGSSRKYASVSDLGEIDYYGGASVFFGARTSQQNYQMVVQTAAGDKLGTINGSTISILLGIGGRYDLGRKHAVGLEYYRTVKSFANSSQRLTTSDNDIALSYQYSLD